MKIPTKRIVEMADDIYMVKFKTEDVEQELGEEDGDGGSSGKDDSFKDPEDEEPLEEDLEKEKDSRPENSGTPKD